MHGVRERGAEGYSMKEERERERSFAWTGYGDGSPLSRRKITGIQVSADRVVP